MSTTEQPRAGRRSNRERLLEALAVSIRERGLRGTQIADIVRLARTSRRTFYECFRDKESCFVELVRESTSELIGAIEAAVERDAPWQTQVDQAVDLYLHTLAGDPAMTATISRELPALGLRGAEVQREGIERYAQLVVRLSEGAASRDGAIRALSLETAIMVVGGLNELVVYAIEHERPLDSIAAVAKDLYAAVINRPR
jgi:AcrR family transcriptional regulator